MSYLANARMYSVTLASKAAWAELFQWVLHESGVDVRLMEHDPPKLLADLWERDDLAGVMMCGLPFSRSLVQPQILAQPVPSIARYQGRAVYCTDIVVAKNSQFAQLAETFGGRAGYTLKDSQSGYYAFRHHLLRQFPSQPEPYASITGGLMNARGVIKAIIEGTIDVGPLDGYVHDLIRHSEPSYADQVRVIASTDPTPMPCIVASPSVSAKDVNSLREAFRASITESSLAPARQTLLLTDFALPEPSVYQVQFERALRVDAAQDWP
jgi:ABC-type phosphate/phosphonate transport system substrate-binding protein